MQFLNTTLLLKISKIDFGRIFKAIYAFICTYEKVIIDQTIYHFQRLIMIISLCHIYVVEVYLFVCIAIFPTVSSSTKGSAILCIQIGKSSENCYFYHTVTMEG